jgi:hypothetical protein
MKASLFTLSVLLASFSAQAQAQCQHPYCSTSSGFDAEHRYAGELPEASPASGEAPSAADFATITAPGYRPAVVRHLVLFRYAPSVTDEQKREVRDRFLALKGAARRDGRPYIVSIETGVQNSGEGASQGLEQGFVVTFKSEGDRNFYVGTPVVTDSRYYDPAHAAFKEFVGPLLDTNGALVFDFDVEARR